MKAKEMFYKLGYTLYKENSILINYEMLDKKIIRFNKKSKYVEKSENINSCFRITSNFTKEEMLAIKQQKKELMW